MQKKSTENHKKEEKRTNDDLSCVEKEINTSSLGGTVIVPNMNPNTLR